MVCEAFWHQNISHTNKDLMENVAIQNSSDTGKYQKVTRLSSESHQVC